MNVNAEYLNNKFRKELRHFQFNRADLGAFRDIMVEVLETRLESTLKEQQQAKKQLTELHRKIENLEERYVQGHIEPSLFEKYRERYQTEKEGIEKLVMDEITSSNLKDGANKCLEIAENISELWDLSQFDDKRRLQQLIFPEGILYNKPKDKLRTTRINSLFSIIPRISASSGGVRRRNLKKIPQNSHLVVPTRIELVSKV